MTNKRSRKVNSNKSKNLTIEGLILSILIALIILLINHYEPYIKEFLYKKFNIGKGPTISYDIGEIPEFSGKPYVAINDNKPNFDESDYYKEFETYSKLDYLGRCGVAYANITRNTMPQDGVNRESITSVKPSGWKNKKYEGLVDGDYLYNRCHLIGWQLAAENDNELNLITGTRYFNVEGMLPFENKVSEYLKDKLNKNNHVLYRVTPIYKNNNLVASGVQMEAYSVEDDGMGVSFNVYVYNVQPGITIDYKTGDSNKEG